MAGRKFALSMLEHRLERPLYRHQCHFHTCVNDKICWCYKCNFNGYIYVLFKIKFSAKLNAYAVVSHDDCYLYNKNYFGKNINGHGGQCLDKTNTAKECHNLCKYNEECNYFSWRGLSDPGREKQCCLKVKKPNNPSDLSGAVVGPKICGNLFLQKI